MSPGCGQEQIIQVGKSNNIAESWGYKDYHFVKIHLSLPLEFFLKMLEEKLSVNSQEQ